MDRAGLRQQIVEDVRPPEHRVAFERDPLNPRTVDEERILLLGGNVNREVQHRFSLGPARQIDDEVDIGLGEARVDPVRDVLGRIGLRRLAL